jgi:predicted XRE-type DNA-binding protein
LCGWGRAATTCAPCASWFAATSDRRSIVERFQKGAYRAVYTAHFGDKVYVLHVFQKKSKSGIATPKHEIELIRNVTPRPSGVIGKDKTDMRKTSVRVTKGSGNVFADLGLPNPEQELLKARLTLQIYRIVKERGLTQTQAGELFGIKQPHVSALMRNRAGNFSIGRLMQFLTVLGQDVEITVKPTRKAQGEMSVVMR